VSERPPTEILRSGDLEVRPSEFLVFANGRVLMLTKKEQQLLAALMRNEGRILSRDELFALVWGRRLRPGDRAVDVYIRKLRARLEEALPQWTFIHTHFGFGYRFAAEPSTNMNSSVTSR
jgi:DNA-binding response OmpR family regulator